MSFPFWTVWQFDDQGISFASKEEAMELLRSDDMANATVVYSIPGERCDVVTLEFAEEMLAFDELSFWSAGKDPWSYFPAFVQRHCAARIRELDDQFNTPRETVGPNGSIVENW